MKRISEKLSKLNPVLATWGRYDYLFFYILIPAILVSIYFLPQNIQNHLILQVSNPKLISIFFSNYTHTEFIHFILNLLWYLLIIFLLFNLESNKKNFYQVSAMFFIILPVSLSLVEINFLPRSATVKGFSAILSGFIGYLVYAVYTHLVNLHKVALKASFIPLLVFINLVLVMFFDSSLLIKFALVTLPIGLLFYDNRKIIEGILNKALIILKGPIKDVSFSGIYKLLILLFILINLFSLPKLIPFEKMGNINVFAHLWGYFFGILAPLTVEKKIEIKTILKLYINKLIQIFRNPNQSLATKLIDNILAFLLVLTYLSIISVFWPKIQIAVFTSMDTIYPVSVISILWFWFRKMNLKVIFALMILFITIYIHSFPLASVPYQEDLRSSIYIQKSKDIQFNYFHGYLTFTRESTILRQRMTFGTVSSLNGGSAYRISPPSSTVKYFINITGKTADGKSITLLYIQNDSVTNKSFPELEGEFILNNLTDYDATLTYVLSEITPHTLVVFSLGGQNNLPYFNNVYLNILLDELSYECMTPCIVPVTEGLNVEPPAVRSGESRLLPKKIETYIQYDIRGTNIYEIRFLIKTAKRIPLILRNLSLAIIAGLTVALISVLLNIQKSK